MTRTVLNIDEEDGIHYAGNIPQGANCRLMRANFDNLIDGAIQAADNAMIQFKEQKPDLAILISCVGRKMLLGLRVEEELEEVRRTLGSSTCMTGFYSYGELAPINSTSGGQLHNQTMTITTLAEK